MVLRGIYELVKYNKKKSAAASDGMSLALEKGVCVLCIHVYTAQRGRGE